MLPKIMRRCSSLAVPILLLPFCLAVPRASAQSGEYVIGPQDVLTITVWDRAELSGKFPVEADGSISYPLIGRTTVGGLTVQRAEQALEKRLSDGYLKKPQVSIAVEQYRSQQIFVMGQVRTPGAYPFTGELTLLEALACAGGLTPEAGSEVILTRATDADVTGPVAADAPQGAAQVTRIDLADLQRAGVRSTLELRPGDTIFVAEAETVFISGQVARPGEYPVRPGTTLRQALALAGGVTDRGSTRRIQVIRAVDGRETELRLGLHEPVRPGDTIVVRERLF
jgi:polysaccharide biosynthesis/export protein